jgi:hypothetical protein
MRVSIPRALLAGLVLVAGFNLAVVPTAHAQASTATTATPYATVVRIRGEVTATAGQIGPSRTLQAGDPVYVGERVRAAAVAEAVLKTQDAGLIAIRPRGEFIMEQYAAPGTSADVFALRMLKGGLRIISGWINRTNRAQYRVSTPSATIGIRGTDHEPYVMSADLAALLGQNEGVYDKVNRGGTTLDVAGNKLDVDPGAVGFVRGTTIQTRGLLTLLLPVLLDKVPEFYVPGQFDAELDRLSQTADDDALRALETRRNAQPGQIPAVPPAPATSAPQASPAAEPATSATHEAKTVTGVAANCGQEAIARAWLGEFDTAIKRRDAPAIVRKFAPEVLVRVTVIGAGGQPTTVDLGRYELAQSTTTAVAGLTDYQQRRLSIQSDAAGQGARICERISVRSAVIEQGQQSGNPYRLESVEEFLLELRGGVWLAIRAETTQQ